MMSIFEHLIKSEIDNIHTFSISFTKTSNMNLSLLSTAITALLALSNAEADSSERTLRRGKNMMAKLQNLIDNGCNSLTCPSVNPSAAECTFEKPEKPSLEGLSEAEIAQMKEDMQAKKEEKKEQILKCACCAGFALEDMIAARPEGEGGSRPGRVGSLRQSVTVTESGATEGAASASESADEDDSSADGSTSADP